MNELEKDILILLSKVRYITETQIMNFFGLKKGYLKRNFKKTLRKMCGDSILKKCLVNINYGGYKDNSYVYYLDGSKFFEGEELLKIILGTEIFIKMTQNGYKIKRFFRNVKLDEEKFDVYIEYIDKTYDTSQIIFEIETSSKLNIFKYENLSEKIQKSTIPFIREPKLLIVSSFRNKILNKNKLKYIDFSLNDLSKYL